MQTCDIVVFSSSHLYVFRIAEFFFISHFHKKISLWLHISHKPQYSGLCFISVFAFSLPYFNIIPELYLIIFPDSYLWHKFLIECFGMLSAKFTPTLPNKAPRCEIIMLLRNVQMSLKDIYLYLYHLHIYLLKKSMTAKSQLTFRSL